jgi:hypothetical protein
MFLLYLGAVCITDSRNNLAPDMLYDPNWYAYNYPAPMYPPPLRGTYHLYPRRPHSRAPLAGPSRGRPFSRGRGYRSRYRGGYRHNFAPHYAPEVEEEYLKYFSKFFNDHDRRSRRVATEDVQSVEIAFATSLVVLLEKSQQVEIPEEV